MASFSVCHVDPSQEQIHITGADARLQCAYVFQL